MHAVPSISMTEVLLRSSRHIEATGDPPKGEIGPLPSLGKMIYVACCNRYEDIVRTGISNLRLEM